MPVERLWDAFLDVERWPQWNPCIWRSRVRDGELREGATLVWTFNAIKPAYLYKLPARAQIVEFERARPGHVGGQRAGFPRAPQLPLCRPRPRPLPVRFLGGGRGTGLSRAAQVLDRPLPLCLSRVAGRGRDARAAGDSAGLLPFLVADQRSAAAGAIGVHAQHRADTRERRTSAPRPSARAAPGRGSSATSLKKPAGTSTRSSPTVITEPLSSASPL